MRIVYIAAAALILWVLVPDPAQAQMTAAERLVEAKGLLRKQGVPCEVRPCTELALRNLKALIEEHPTAPEVPFARYLSGICLIRLGRYDEAVKPLEEALHAPVDRRGRENILWNLAFVYLRSLDFARARQTYETFLKEFPESRNAEDAKNILGPLKLVGAKAPAFKAKDINGKPLDLKAFAGRPVLLHFWATWCPASRKELPNIKKAYDEFHSKGLAFVGVGLDKDATALANYLKANGVPWPHYCDEKEWNCPLAKIYDVNRTPVAFLIDRRGIVRYAEVRGETLFKAIRILLLDGK